MLNRGKRESNHQKKNKNRTRPVCCTGQTRHFSPDSFPSWTLPAWTYTAGTRALLPSSPVLGLSRWDSSCPACCGSVFSPVLGWRPRSTSGPFGSWLEGPAAELPRHRTGAKAQGRRGRHGKGSEGAGRKSWGWKLPGRKLNPQTLC